MSDDTETPKDAQLEPAAPELELEPSGRADRAQAILAAARPPKTAPAAPAAPGAQDKRGPGRPRKEAGAPGAPAAPGARRKKPSGRKPTRAELAAKVKQLQAERGPSSSSSSSSSPAEPAPAPSSGLQSPDVRGRFAAGVSRLAQQGGRMVAARRGTHWTVTKVEGDALGEATADAVVCVEALAPSLGPYIGKAVELAPLAIFAGVLFGIVQERMERDAEIAAGRAPQIMPASAPAVALVPSEAR